MNNVEALRDAMQEIVKNERYFDNSDKMAIYMASIATSLAVIADKIQEGDNGLQNKND